MKKFDEILGQIEQLLPKDSDGNFLAFNPGATGAEEKSDVVHDFLAYLAEEMTELNKQKQAEIKGFLQWLETFLRIKPDNDGNTGIEALSSKSILKNYLGDYQKGEPGLSFDGLMDILRKNKKKIGANVSNREAVEQIKNEYTASLEKLLVIKGRLKKTDWLIDQIVYRLYGLPQEEIDSIESPGS